MSFPFFKQLDSKDCGPSCLRMISAFYGKKIDQKSARTICGQYKNGTTMLSIKQGAKQIGIDAIGLRCTLEEFTRIFNSPCIVQWNKNHFVVVYSISGSKIYVADPAIGLLVYDKKSFFESWWSHHNKLGEKVGVVMLFEPNEQFNADDSLLKSDVKRNFTYIKFLKPHRKLIFQLSISLLIGSFLSLIFPYLAQSIVDIGIESENTMFIIYVLIGQLGLNLGMGFNRYISSWLFLHISSRVSINMISHFLERMMKLHISFFDSKMIGDLLQRIQDFSRIENFMTSALISITIALIGIIVYSVILMKYGMSFLVVYIAGSIVFVFWVITFKNKRKRIDYKRFQEISANQSLMIHYIRGIHEIKLNNCEDSKINNWKHIQQKIYEINISGLKLAQIQDIGALIIDQTKNIIISFMAAYAVINGALTIGMMLAISYILGQLNSPLYQISSFIQSFQDAQISMERIDEISMDNNEDDDNKNKICNFSLQDKISFKDVWFKYPGSVNDYVLKDLSFEVPVGSVTAIVGESGSGKSTLLKLILGFYSVSQGEINIDSINIGMLDIREWRKRCSAILQDGYIFTDTIANNISLSSNRGDIKEIKSAAENAKINDFIDNLPLNYNTVIGEDGLNLSGGQKQRLLIARAIYKNAEVVIMDEATNALDANNENNILENLKKFYVGKTVIIVAHRLSTIVNSDNIIVLQDGAIKEQGTHQKLMNLNGYYASLINRQIFV